MKKIILSAASLAVAAVASVSVAPTTSEAVPAFARQTGAACLNCHFQAIPRLAPMGREFRMNAFRDISQDVIEDEHLSLPAVFNASFLMKTRISSGSGDLAKGGAVGTANGAALQMPDEAAILFGGRLSEHSGLFTEWEVVNGEMLGFKFAHVVDMDSGILAIAVGTTDALGAPSIFNDPSNAISRNTRGVQTRANALRGGILHDAASGLGVYGYMADSVYFAAGLVGQGGGLAAGNAGLEIPTGTYIRAAYIADIAGLDTIIGFHTASTLSYGEIDVNGDAVAVAGTGNEVLGEVNGTEDTQTGIDLQIQGDIAGMSVGIYAPITIAGMGEGANEVSGAMVYANIAVSSAAGVRLGYDVASTDNGYDYSGAIVGGWYDLAQNVALDLEIVSKSQTAATGAVEATGVETTLMLELVY